MLYSEWTAGDEREGQETAVALSQDFLREYSPTLLLLLLLLQLLLLHSSCETGRVWAAAHQEERGRMGMLQRWHETDRTASYKQGIWYPTNMVTKHIFHLSQQNACVDVIKQVKSNKTRVSSPKMTLINEWRHLKILNRPDIIQLVYIVIHVMVLHNQN